MSSTLDRTRTPSFLAARPAAGPLRAAVLDEISRLFARRSATPIDVLSVLATSHRAMSRQEICRLLTIAPKTLSECLTLLEREAFVVSSRRFMVTLGARFLDDAALSRIFRDTTLALARPHLELLSHSFDGTASIAFGSGGSCIVADTVGQLDSRRILETSGEVLTQAIRGASWQTATPALGLDGIWAAIAGDVMVIASRVELKCSAAAIAITTRAQRLDEFSELSRTVFTVANDLTSALRRVYPSSSPFGATSDRDEDAW